MNWYLTKLVYEVRLQDQSEVMYFDEQWRFVIAKNWEEALFRAGKIGLKEELGSELLIEAGVEWKFLNISDLIELSEEMDGSEIFGRLQNAENAEIFRNETNKKANIVIGTHVLKDMKRKT